MSEAAAASLRADGVGKSFGGVRALDGASFAAAFGEVHALVGENGAGKSTLIKILGGRLRPDGGAIAVKGQRVHFRRPEDAHALGIRTVFQELSLLPWMTVAENLLLRREPRGALGLIGRRRLVEEADAKLAALGVHHLDPRLLVEDLSLAERQTVEIARVLLREPEILLLDEPTSSLLAHEVDWLFGLVRALRDKGACVIFTSHRWQEVTRIADRLTIFRNGSDVGCFERIDESEAVTLMTGRRIETLYPPLPPVPTGTPLLEADGIGARPVSFALRAGEILGIGGLAGHGHRELFLTLFGALATQGRILIDGKPARLKSPRDAIAAGIAFVPEDRKAEGLLLPMTLRDNLTLAILRRVSLGGIIRLARERGLARGMLEQLSIKGGLGRAVGTLSGGNQQKVLIGRWLLAQSRICLFYDVTRGVNVATKHEIYELIARLAGEGRAILVYSSDAEELAHLCHRVLVLREGRIAAELTPPLDAEAIVGAAVRDAVAA